MKRFCKILESNKPLVWLFYGDSITHGALHTFGCRDYTELFSERLRYELGRTMDIVVNTAISGNTTLDLLDSFDWRVRSFLPNIVFVMIGMNDCSPGCGVSLDGFCQNLKELIKRIKTIDALPVLQTTCPILPGSEPIREKYFSDYMDIIRELAMVENICLIDHAKYWQENSKKHYYWMSNEFHPNGFGHRVFANTIFNELDIFDVNSPTCQLFIP